MKYIIIKLGDEPYSTKSYDTSMNVLGEWLAHNRDTHVLKQRIKWLLAPDNDQISDDKTFMDKVREKVILGSLTVDNPNESGLTVPIPVMIDLLKQWDAVCRNKFDEAVIYYENGKFKVEGKHVQKKHHPYY